MAKTKNLLFVVLALLFCTGSLMVNDVGKSNNDNETKYKSENLQKENITGSAINWQKR